MGSTSGGDVYKVLASTYFGERYITTLSGTTVTISKETCPILIHRAHNQKVVATFTVAPGATTLRYSPGDNRFVMVQSGEHIAGYDLELMQSSRLTLATAPRGLLAGSMAITGRPSLVVRPHTMILTVQMAK